MLNFVAKKRESWVKHVGAQDKQLTPFLLTSKLKWKMIRNYWKLVDRNVQTFGYVYPDTNGQNHGPVWKIQSFLLSDICTVIFWQDYYGKGNLRESYWSKVGRKFPTGNACSYTVQKYSYLCMWMTSNWLERNKSEQTTSFTQRKRRVLPVTSHRALFERRQLQFPARQK